MINGPSLSVPRTTYKKGDIIQLSEEGIRIWSSSYQSGGRKSGRPVLRHDDIIGVVIKDQLRDDHAFIMRLHHSSCSSWSLIFWKPVEKEEE